MKTAGTSATARSAASIPVRCAASLRALCPFRSRSITPDLIHRYGQEAARELVSAARNSGPRASSWSGHTDVRGTAETNMRLSRDRADAVASFLRENGLIVPVETAGRDRMSPCASSDTSGIKSGRYLCDKSWGGVAARLNEGRQECAHLLLACSEGCAAAAFALDLVSHSVPVPQESVAVRNKKGGTVRALIIGVDAYRHYRPLKGAVAKNRYIEGAPAFDVAGVRNGALQRPIVAIGIDPDDERAYGPAFGTTNRHAVLGKRCRSDPGRARRRRPRSVRTCQKQVSAFLSSFVQSRRHSTRRLIA